MRFWFPINHLPLGEGRSQSYTHNNYILYQIIYIYICIWKGPSGWCPQKKKACSICSPRSCMEQIWFETPLSLPCQVLCRNLLRRMSEYPISQLYRRCMQTFPEPPSTIPPSSTKWILQKSPKLTIPYPSSNPHPAQRFFISFHFGLRIHHQDLLTTPPRCCNGLILKAISAAPRQGNGPKSYTDGRFFQENLQWPWRFWILTGLFKVGCFCRWEFFRNSVVYEKNVNTQTSKKN